MGLDSVEILIEVEDAFGIAIPDASAQRIRTAGDLYRCVLGKLEIARELRERKVCPSAHVFYQLRRAASATLGIDRRVIQLQSNLGEWLGRDRRSAWQRLEIASELRFPTLVLPRWIRGLILALALLSIPGAGLFLWSTGVNAFSTFLLLNLLAPFATLLLLLRITRPLAFVIPAGCETVRGLVEELVRSNLGTFTSENGELATSEEVWEKIRRILADQLGVAVDRVTDQARLIEDLGMD